jgi:hypothetical protein
MNSKKTTREEKCLLAIKLGFTYCELTGNITTPTGKILTKKTKAGYLHLCLRDSERNTYNLSAHQFAWYVKYKVIVPLIDHKNRIKFDNRISNLRSITKSQNAMNRSNIKGYTYCKGTKKYIAIIMVNYKKKALGTFSTEEEAHKCYLENKHKYHKIID